jgi:hypothetical protein
MTGTSSGIVISNSVDMIPWIGISGGDATMRKSAAVAESARPVTVWA